MGLAQSWETGPGPPHFFNQYPKEFTMEQKPMMVSKVTLGSGKVVLLREMKIKHQEQAALLAAPKSGDNNTLLALHMQKELLKLLIVQIDGKDVKPAALENLDDVFSMMEYGQLLKVMRQLMGDEADMGKFQVETVSSGAN
jgi:hypothetical protein